MRAVAIAEDRSLVTIERPREEPGPGQALIEVAFCGICGSDLHFRDVPELFPQGSIPGHEMSGRVVALGGGVPAWRLGERVTVLHFVPSYCPHLNPIERLWALMHQHLTHNKTYPTCREFADAILNFLRDEVPRKWGEFCDSVTDNFRVVLPANFRILA